MDYHAFLDDSYVDHTTSTVKELYYTKSFADVTLVCHNNIKVKAHKFILSSNSEVFELTLKMVDDVVNIPNVRPEEMSLILQFMYTGQVEVPKKSIVEFSQAANELKVKYIDEELMNECVKKQTKSFEKTKSIKKEDGQIEPNEVLCSSDDSFMREQSSASLKRKNGLRPPTNWKCKECDLPLHKEASYNSHMEKVHHKTKWKCIDCDKSFKTYSGYSYHKDSVHEQLKHPCPECPMKLSSKSNLNLHITSKHMNISYQCKQCPYKGTQAASLRRHIKLQHSVVKHDKIIEKYW